MFTRTRQTASAPVDLDDHVVADLRCIRCGMSIQGLSVGGPCTHCGHPCSDSVYGDYLIYSDRAEVERLEEAARLVQYGGMVAGLIMVAAVVGMVVRAGDAVEAIRGAWDGVYAGVMVFPLIGTMGMVLLTRRYSVAYYEAKYFHQRVLIRAGLVVGLVLVALGVAAYYLPRTLQVVLLCAWATLPVVAFLRGVVRLMRRVPNLALAGRAGALGAAVWAAGLLMLLSEVLRPHCPQNADWEAALIALQAFLAAGWIALGAGIYHLLVVIRRGFRQINR